MTREECIEKARQRGSLYEVATPGLVDQRRYSHSDVAIVGGRVVRNRFGDCDPPGDGWANAKTPGDVFVNVMAEMYECHDEAFLKLVREIGKTTDDTIVAAEEFVDAIQEASGALRRLVRATWRRNRAAWAMRPMLAEAIRRRKVAEWRASTN